MLKLFAPLLITATSLVSPAVAGIHDFTPSNVGPSRPRVSSQNQAPRGDCHETRDLSRLCWFRNAQGNYNLAIVDSDYPDWPASIVANCKTGKWQSYSGLPKQQVQLWVRIFCSQV